MDSTQDMNPQGQPSQDTTGFLSLGVEEDGGELHEAEPAEILLTEEGEKEMDTEPVPEQGAPSAEGKAIEAEEEAIEAEEEAIEAEEEAIEAEEEAKEDGDSGLDGLDAPGPIYHERDERNEPDEDSDDSDEEPEEQEQEAQPLQANVRRPQPRNRRRVAQRTTFTMMQMQELERIFHRYPYPDMLMRQDIARCMNVTEARVQIWFKNRRRRQRAFMLRNMHPMVLGNPIGINVGVPHIIFNAQPALMYLPHAWMWYPHPAWIRYTQPLPLGLLMPPVVPYPPLFMHAPQPLFYPPLPHGGPHPRVWAWFFSVFYP